MELDLVRVAVYEKKGVSRFVAWVVWFLVFSDTVVSHYFLLLRMEILIRYMSCVEFGLKNLSFFDIFI